MHRIVTLAVVDDDGIPLGLLPPFHVDIPYWQEVSDVVAGARAQFGVEITVLRILSSQRPVPHGGAVTYLAQASQIPRQYASSVHIDLTPDPRRAAYALPGGPAAGLRWAAQALQGHGLGPVTASSQQRTWNLSAIWRLATASGPIWLKHVPAFFAHEAAVLRWAASTSHRAVFPSLIADWDGRMLLNHVPGEDLYECAPAIRDAIAADLHDIQVTGVDQVDTLLAAGVPDRRATALAGVIAAVVEAYGGDDAALHNLVAGLEDRLAKVVHCGLPDTLVHGDLHPGNVIGDGDRRVIIDWGDSFVGHPAFDVLRLTDRLDPGPAAALTDAWVSRWRAAVPNSDPRTALELLAPVAALRNAAVFADFLANIEPAEHPYHRADIDLWLAKATSTRSP